MSQIFYPFPTEDVSSWPDSGLGGGYAGHQGTDWPLAVGTPVGSSCDGTITFIGNDGASGTYNAGGKIVYANGPALVTEVTDATGLIHRFAHLSEQYGVVGQRVVAGQIIAASGNSGFTDGPHLHWELRYDRAWSGGPWVDPRALNARPASEIGQAAPTDEEGDEMTLVKGPDGRWFWMDGDGVVEDIYFNYFMPNGPDATPTKEMNGTAAKTLASRIIIVEDQWIWELMRHQAQQRFAKKNNAVAQLVLAGMKPLLAAIAPTVDPKQLEDAVKAGVAEIELVTEETVRAIAESSARATLELAAAGLTTAVSKPTS